MTEGMKSHLPGKGQGQGQPHHSTTYRAATKRIQALSSPEATARRQGIRDTSSIGRGFISMYEIIFYSEINHSLSNLPRDVVESPSLKVFKVQLDRELDTSSGVSFP